MRPVKLILMCGILLAGLLLINGCDEEDFAYKADEAEPITEVKTEAEKLDVKDLRSTTMKYKDQLIGKKTELNNITAKLKDIPVTDMLGTEAKDLTSQIDTLNKSIAGIKEKYDFHYNLLKQKGGDLSGLDI